MSFDVFVIMDKTQQSLLSQYLCRYYKPPIKDFGSINQDGKERGLVQDQSCATCATGMLYDYDVYSGSSVNADTRCHGSASFINMQELMLALLLRLAVSNLVTANSQPVSL